MVQDSNSGFSEYEGKRCNRDGVHRDKTSSCEKRTHSDVHTAKGDLLDVGRPISTSLCFVWTLESESVGMCATVSVFQKKRLPCLWQFPPSCSNEQVM
jgi:hypothetical protein